MQFSRSLSAHLIWKGLGLVVNLIITILLSRMLQAAESGLFFYYISWLSFLILIASLGLDPAITYFLSNQSVPKSQLISLVVVWLLTIISILLIAGLFWGYQQTFIRTLPLDGVLLGVLFIAGQLLITFSISFFYGEQYFVLPAQLLFITSLIYVVFLAIVSFDLIPDIHSGFLMKSYIYLVFFQGLLLSFAQMFLSRKISFRFFELDILLLKKVVRYGLWAFFANLLFFAVTRIDYWILTKFNQPAKEIGNYIQVSRLAQLFQLLPSMLASFLFPIAASSKQEIVPYMKKLSRWIIIMEVIIIFFIILFGNSLFPVIFGESFNRMYSLFMLFIPGILSLSVLAIVSTYFSGNNMVRVNMWISLISLLFVCTFDWLLIPSYGVEAAAMVSSLGYLLCLFLTLLIFKNKTGFKISDFFIVKIADFKAVNRLIFALIQKKS